MLRLLALDLGTTFGFAGVTYGQVFYGHQKIKSGRGVHPGSRYSQFSTHLSTWITWLPPQARSEPTGSPATAQPNTTVYYERPYNPPGHSAQILHGYASLVEMYCYEAGMRTEFMSPMTIKKYATGTGRAQKEDMIEAAKERWGIDVTHDEADALFLLAYAAEKEEVTLPASVPLCITGKIRMPWR